MPHEGFTDPSHENDTNPREVPEVTNRALGLTSFTNTQYALTRDWAPARNRDDAPKNIEEHPAHLSERLRELRT